MQRALVLVTMVATVAAASAAIPRVIYSTIQSSPTSDVPGLAGVKFDNDTTGFLRPYQSPNGQYWILEAQLNSAATTDDEIVLVGSGLTGAVAVREGDQAPWAGVGETVGPIREKMAINNSGHYVFGQNLGGTAGTDRDEQIVLNNGAFSLAASEGGAVPGIAGEVYGGTLEGPSITNAGVVGFDADSTVGVLPAEQDEVLVLNNNVVTQAGVTIPGNQAFAPNETWQFITGSNFYVSGDGSKWLVNGDLNGATGTDAVVVVNGEVVWQEGTTPAGLNSPLTSTTLAPILTPAGDVFIRGETTNDLEDYVMRNGVVLAKTGEDVPGGLPGEKFSEAIFDATFFTMAGNSLGDFVYGATTDNADPEFDAVIVLNDSEVVLRQGDPVDVNGDGLFNDNAFIDVFNNEDMFLTDDLWLYFSAELRDGASATIGQAYLRVQAPEPAGLVLLALGGLAVLRRR